MVFTKAQVQSEDRLQAKMKLLLLALVNVGIAYAHLPRDRDPVLGMYVRAQNI